MRARWTRWTLPLVCLVALLSLGCPHPFYRYKGDGEFQDTWIGYPGVRYWLILDQFNTSQKTTRTFNIGKLPNAAFHVGFYLAEFDEKALFNSKQEPVSGLAVIHARVTDNMSGKIIIDEKGSLSDKTWSLTGTNPIQKTTDTPSIWFGAFTPDRGHTYTLEVAIEQPDKMGLDLELRVTGCPSFHYGSL